MARLACFPTLHVGRKKKSKDSPKSVHPKKGNSNGAPQVMPEGFVYPSIEKVRKDTSCDDSASLGFQGKRSSENEKVVVDENSVRAKAETDAAYEGGDEHDESLSIKRDFSDFDLQTLVATQELNSPNSVGMNQESNNNGLENKSERRGEGMTPEPAMQSGHVSDPGMGQTTAFWGSPMLKRSCSNIETKRFSQLPLSPTKSHSYNDLQNLSEIAGENLNGFHGSPLSMISNCSADKVMLKKRSSRQMLPSRSRKLWWKLFLWSHRNLHRPWTSRPQNVFFSSGASNQKGGYSSDTLELKLKNKEVMEEPENRSQADLWPQNQWVAFSVGSSPFDRVNAWVNSLEDSPCCLVDDEENDDGEPGGVAFPNTSEIGESSGKHYSHTDSYVPDEVMQANNIIQSLNSFTTVAHISGMALKVIPSISPFSSLRAVNLSRNFIVHITPGSLPKSLHVLDLSRNKISTIEGLRELTRLRVLNLSYNRISRIGHGLSNCTLIKELYLAGNKISDVEGLHRLLKLSVLDLSFNKITTTKALGQLVANYHSLQAINLLGNPIQSNIGDDQLRKAVCGLLPHLTYLNKQPIKPQRVREVASDSVARAALGNSGWNSRRRLARRANQGSSTTSVNRGATSRVGTQKSSSRHRSKSRHH